MRIVISVLIFLAQVGISYVVANSSGAPCSAYDTMTPQHGAINYIDASAGRESPYSIRMLDAAGAIEVTQYHYGGVYTVEVTATEPIKGLLIEARRMPMGQQDGEFLQTATFNRFCLKHQRCGYRVVQNSVTHSNNVCATRMNCTKEAPCVFSVIWRATNWPRNAIRMTLTGLPEYKRAYIRNYSPMIFPDFSKISPLDASLQSLGVIDNPQGSDFVCTGLVDEVGYTDWCPDYCNDRCCRTPDSQKHCRRTCCVKNLF